jgi:hypothetical protein
MKLLTALLFSALLAFSEDKKPDPPKPIPTVAELQKQVEEKEQQIQWMTQVINGLNAKLDALGKYYSANEQLIRLDQIKPLVKPEPVAQAPGTVPPAPSEKK